MTTYFQWVSKSKSIKYIAWIFVILWLVVIFALSAQPAAQSNQLSMEASKDLMFAAKDSRYMANGFPNPAFQITQLNNLVRQWAHGVIYFVLGILVVNAVVIQGKLKLWQIPAAFIFCAVYAVTDEIHQLFVPGRTCSLLDLAVDSLGSLAGILLCWVFVKVIRKLQNQHVHESGY